MGEHRLADHVADGEDVRHSGALLGVDGDEAALVHRHARLVGIDFLAVRTPPDRHQHLVEDLCRAFALGVLEGDLEPVLLGLDLGDLGLQQDLGIAPLDALVQRLDHVLVGAGDDLVHQLDHGDLGAERVIDAGHFQPDDAAAQHQHLLGDLVQFQRAGRIDHPGIVIGHEGQGDRLGSGGDDALIEADIGHALIGLDRDHVGTGEAPVAIDHLHLAGLGQAREPAGELLDHRFLPAAQRVQVDLRSREPDAVIGHFLGLGDHLRGMEQRLGGDAADIQADPAEIGILLDQHHLLAQVGGPEGGSIAARAGAEHDHLAVDVALAAGGAGGGAGLGRRCRLGFGAGRLGGRVACLGALQHQDHAAFGDLVPFLDLDFLDRAGGGRGHFHRCLVAFQLDQRVFLGDGIADRDQDRDDRHILEIADIGNLDVHCARPLTASAGARRRADISGWRRTARPVRRRWRGDRS